MTGKSFPDATPPNLCPAWVRAGVWVSPQEAAPGSPPSPDKLKNLFRLEPRGHILSRSQPWSEGMTKLSLNQHHVYWCHLRPLELLGLSLSKAVAPNLPSCHLLIYTVPRVGVTLN